MGFEVVGFLDDHARRRPIVLGTLDDLIPVMDETRRSGPGAWTSSTSASRRGPARRSKRSSTPAATRLAHICLVPDLFQFEMILNSRVSDIDGLPIIHLIDETPFDFRRVVKRERGHRVCRRRPHLLAPIFLFIAAPSSSPHPAPCSTDRSGWG